MAPPIAKHWSSSKYGFGSLGSSNVQRWVSPFKESSYLQVEECQPVEYIDTKRFEYEAFLAEVVGKPAGGKHIAIIGEPGAGKTTILTKIGAWLIKQAEQQPPAPLVVAWISLADVGDRRLQDYLQAEWLQKVCEDNFDAAWEDWKRLRQQGRVWLLLDGLDEMSGDALTAIHRDLGQAWAQNLQVVMTCRINQWETAAGGNILTNSFDVYRTLDYSYQTSQGDDQVKEFISKWFADNQKVATQIRTELDAPGKERIKDLVKNPLRLTLLCASWEKDNQALPETQAGLYEKFVDYLYDWKAVEFYKEVELREELDLALGKLAKEGLNRQQMNDVAVRRFRFTTSEIRGLWGKQSKELIAAAKNLGWLNVVEKDTYAFYHPTFQEYFAACSIDDWDYFLPRAHIDRPVPCQGEIVPTYRVFEKQWQQVILLWIGRSDLRDESKEELIEKLTNWKQKDNDFYYHRSYCIAGICVGEFKSSFQSETITKQIVEWIFYSYSEEEKWMSLSEEIEALAIENITFLHTKNVMSALISLLKCADEDEYCFLSRRVIDRLGEIGAGTEIAISALVQLVEQKDLKHWLRSDAIHALAQISMGSETAISALIRILEEEDLKYWLRSDAAHALGQISVKHKRTIFTLVKLLEREDLEYNLHYRLAYALGKIDIGNPIAIDTLIWLIKQKDFNNYWHQIGEILEEVAFGNQKASDSLLDLLDYNHIESIDYHHILHILEMVAIDNKKATKSLVFMLQDSNLEINLRSRLINVLGTIGVKDQQTIDALIQILFQNSSGRWLRSDAVNSLGKVGVGNKKAINILSQYLSQNNLDNSICCYIANALGLIDKGNRQAIDTLTQILHESPQDYLLITDVIKALGEIDDKNQQVIDIMAHIMRDKRLSYLFCFEIIEILENIGVGNNGLVDALIGFLQSNCFHENDRRDSYFHNDNKKSLEKAVQALGMIGRENNKAINCFIQLLSYKKLDKGLYAHVANSLGEIAVGDRFTTDSIIQLLKHKDLGSRDFIDAEIIVSVLKNISTKQTMPSIVEQLQYYLTNEIDTSDVIQVQHCHQVLFYCAQTLSYSVFQSASYSTNTSLFK